jgi:hypothetical protein
VLLNSSKIETIAVADFPPLGEIPATIGEKFTASFRCVDHGHAMLLSIGQGLEPIVIVGLRIAMVAIVGRGVTMSVSEGGPKWL